jgi:dipeptidyl aminopeptidase/acylaminoacyl peptidase
MRNAALLVALTLGLGSAAHAADSPQPFVAADFASIHGVAEPQLSPDGTRVVYTVSTTDLKKDKTSKNLWLVDFDGSHNRAITFGEDKQSHPRWSADGQFLAFLSSRSDENEDDQVWILPLAGGEAEKLTGIKGGVEDFAWSPDSTRLALVVRDPDPRAPENKADKKTPPPLVLDRFKFKRDILGYLTERFSHLQIVTRANRQVEVLTSGRHDDLFPAWSPDGREIAFMSQRAAEPDRSEDWSILAVGAARGATQRVIATAPQSGGFGRTDQPFAWSADGKSIAFIHSGDPKLLGYGARHLSVVSSSGGVSRDLSAAVDRNVSHPLWSADGAGVLVLLENDGDDSAVNFSVNGGAPRIVAGGTRRISDFHTTRNGRMVVASTTVDSPVEIFAAEKGLLRPLSKQNDVFMLSRRVARVESTKFKSADGTEIHGWLVYPLDAPPAGARSPALLRPHGGPQSQYAAAFNFEAQLFAANGYAVILPNPRGSTGRGTDYSKAIYADWGHLDVEDDLAAVDDAIARGFADPNRLGVGGWSYGGMTTNYVIASSTRFKAATSGASISNILAGYGTDHYVSDYEYELGTPWKNLSAWMRISYPFYHADQIATPTLFLCGEKDFNVPCLNSEQMYQALQSLQVPTELVIYPGQFHGLTKPSYILDRYQRYLNWYAKYLLKTS